MVSLIKMKINNSAKTDYNGQKYEFDFFEFGIFRELKQDQKQVSKILGFH